MKDTYNFDIVVVGAGVIGISIALACAHKNFSVLLIEKNSNFGREISSRNSEVIHAGIYYPEHSLKAKFCRDGMKRLYKYCNKKNIPIKKTGKLIVQTHPKDQEKLFKIYEAGIKNGCDELSLLTSNQLKKLESEVNAENAIWSPNTGILDSHQFMKSMLDEFEKANGIIVYNHNLKKVIIKRQNFELPLDQSTTLLTKNLINCCGLNATNFAQNIEGYPKKFVKKTIYCKGTYFGYQGLLPFSHHIYPIPNKAGLGIHFTLDLNNNGQFGPDTEWVNSENYTVSNNRIRAAYDEIKKYWPKCCKDNIRPVYAGIRPKIGSRINFEKDFIIQTNSDHRIPGLINLLGIESPGLTSALSIAYYVVENYL